MIKCVFDNDGQSRFNYLKRKVAKLRHKGYRITKKLIVKQKGKDVAFDSSHFKAVEHLTGIQKRMASLSTVNTFCVAQKKGHPTLCLLLKDIETNIANQNLVRYLLVLKESIFIETANIFVVSSNPIALSLFEQNQLIRSYQENNVLKTDKQVDVPNNIEHGELQSYIRSLNLLLGKGLI